jgi:cold shock CspA family protein
MLKGTVTNYNPRRGTGYLTPLDRDDQMPFTARDSQGGPLAAGDRIEYTVVGGLAGVVAREVRRIVESA